MNLNAFELVTALSSQQLLTEKYALEISSIDICKKNLYIGTNDGKLKHFYMEENTEGKGGVRYVCLEQGIENLSLKKPITQILALTSLKQILLLCDSTLFTLNMMDLKVNPSSSKLKAVSIFCINHNPLHSDPFSVQLCVGSRRRCIQVHIQTEDSLTLLWEIATTSVPVSLQMNREIVCVGLENEYRMINVQTGTKQDLFPFDPHQIPRPIITHIADDEFLVSAPNALGVFTQSGGISQRPPLQWTNNIRGFVYCHPYIVVMNDEFITVHSIIDQQQKQTIAFEGGKLLGLFEGRIFIAGSKILYSLSSVPIEQQIEHLIEQHRLNEAIQLANLSIPSSCQDLRLITSRLHIQAGIKELRQANFSAAKQLLREGGAKVVELFDLFPHLFPSGSVPLSSSPTSLSTPPTISLSSSRPISHAISPTTTSTHSQASSSLSSLLLKIRRLSTSNHQLTTDDALMLKYETFLYDFILESNGGGDDNDGEGDDNDGEGGDNDGGGNDGEGNDGEDNDGGNDGGVDKGATYDASLHSQSRLIQTAFVKLTAKLHPSKLLPLLHQSRASSYDVNSCSSYLQQLGYYHAAAVANSCGNPQQLSAAMDLWKRLLQHSIEDNMFPGDDYVFNFLKSCSSNDVIREHMAFLFQYDQVKAIKIFTERKKKANEQKGRKDDGKNDDSIKHDHVLNFLSSAPPPSSSSSSSSSSPSSSSSSSSSSSLAYQHALMLYLEYMVFEEGVEQEPHHTHLATTYLNLILSQQPSSQQPSSQQPSTQHPSSQHPSSQQPSSQQPSSHPTLTIESVRSRLRHFLSTSNLYRVQWMIGKLQNTQLLHELAILYGKTEEHDKALDILVNKLSDYSAAENYVIDNSKNRNQSYCCNLFHQLLDSFLHVYEQSGHAETCKKHAVDLLCRHKLQFDLIKVLESIPADWSLCELQDFTINSLRHSASVCRNSKIEAMLLEGTQRVLREEMSERRCEVVAVSEDKHCFVCGKPFLDTHVVFHPLHQALTHLQCQHSFTSALSSSFSASPPSFSALPSSFSPSSGYASSFSGVSSISPPHGIK